MKIAIEEKFLPFSNLPGTKTVLPLSEEVLQVFPKKLKFLLAGIDVAIDFQGHFEAFTVFNDLEKMRVAVHIKTSEGIFRYFVFCCESAAWLFVEKSPQNGLKVNGSPSENKQKICLFELEPTFHPNAPLSRLFLGVHKAQDWDLILRRKNLREIFPFWHRLGRLVPSQGKEENGGVASLLNSCKNLLEENKPEKSEKKWLQLFQAGFDSLLVPHLDDPFHLGLIKPVEKNDVSSPFILLTKGSDLIEYMLVHQKENTVHVLPHLFPLFHCGRLTDAILSSGKMSIEWTKHAIRRFTFVPNFDQELKFCVKDARSYRLRSSKTDKGKRFKADASHILSKNCLYFFDNFE